MTNLEDQFKNRIDGMNKSKQILDWEKVGRLGDEVYKVPTEFREAKKKEFWEAMRKYNLKYETKYNRFERP